MKKLILFTMILSLAGCQDSEYSSFLRTQDMSEVTKLTISPNSPVLIADGKCELKFVVKAYMQVEDERTVEVLVDGAGVVKDSLFSTTTTVKPDRLLGEDMAITTSRGETVENFTYSTSTGAGEVIEFTCTLGGITSAPCRVELIPKPAAYTREVVVPVVFHILSETSTLAACNAITAEAARKHLDRANKAFAGELYPTAPAWADANVRFVPATHDPDGVPLAEAGIDRHDFGNNFLEGYLYNTGAFMWDPDRYLNIYVYGGTYGGMTDTSGPQSILTGKTLPGFPSGYSITEVDSPAEAYYGWGDSSWGLVVDIAKFKAIGKPGNDIRFEYLIGKFYGLMDTYYRRDFDGQDPWNLYYFATMGDVDYCGDTYTYRSKDMSIEKETYLTDGAPQEPLYYNSYNIMDGSSISMVLTPEQAARVRFVMENCPGRMAGWNEQP